MSRAFVKDDDDRPERPPSRPVSGNSNYVTPDGLALLQEALARARAAADERNVEYYAERVASAEVVDPRAGAPGVVAFGSTVVAREEGRGAKIRLRIVGEDEADPLRGTISWVSPYAQALMGHRVGDRAVVQRPAGQATVVIEAVELE
ncbi:MAG: GreA/GreB family elongation factor [Candidatus Tumulicola sp.]